MKHKEHREGGILFFWDVHSSCYVNFTSTSHTAVNPDPNVCINVGVRGHLYRANEWKINLFVVTQICLVHNQTKGRIHTSKIVKCQKSQTLAKQSPRVAYLVEFQWGTNTFMASSLCLSVFCLIMSWVVEFPVES